MSDLKFKFFLGVPREQKDEAKALGARWHPKIGLWYVTSKAACDRMRNEWIQGIDRRLILVAPPISLVTGSASCWKCKVPVTMSGLLIQFWKESEDGFGERNKTVVLYNINKMHSDVLQAIEGKGIKLHLQKTRHHDPYYLVICKCGAPQGDSFQHDPELGGYLFGPRSSLEASKLTLQTLDLRDEYAFIGRYIWDRRGEYIARSAQKL